MEFTIAKLGNSFCNFVQLYYAINTDSARICLTHSFPYKDIRSYNGENDCDNEDTEFIQRFITEVEYNEYDALIQLCDAISLPAGPCCVEKRLVDVVLRKCLERLKEKESKGEN
ncbi:hypothetical protein [Clostridium thermosuccinogenes]|uniref:hypothetical protein n=1 Tax=Clostridium thermosuccinogenes TaxID=84032 RepID=UPI00137B8A6E|nr:hypothetical protein [Pseudoclostridium thermosuccinogenes]